MADDDRQEGQVPGQGGRRREEKDGDAFRSIHDSARARSGDSDELRLTGLEGTNMIPPDDCNGLYRRRDGMGILIVRRILTWSALGLTFGVTTTRADSILTIPGEGTMFTATDLGSSYTLQQDSTGTVHSVTSGDGGQTYAFEKAPVTPINSTVFNTPNFWDWHDLSTTYLFQVGATQVGYETSIVPFYGFDANTPLGIVRENGWYTTSGSPVSDVNSGGQFVGTGDPGPGAQSFAAFSSPTGGMHDRDVSSLFADNLNTYIASNLGINLTAALKIDDLGDIIAEGTLDGKDQDFLLTLNGPPTPAPEPSTLAALAAGIVALGTRSVLRRRETFRTVA